MGFIQKDAVRTMLLSYLGMFLGYFNKAFLFILLLTTEEIGLLNLILSVGLLFAQFCNLGTVYSVGKFFPFFRNKAQNNYGFLQYNVLIVTVGVAIFTTLALVFKGNIASYYSDKSPDFVRYYLWFIPIGIAYIYFFLFENYLRALYKNVISVFLYEVLLRILTAISLIAYGLKWIDFELLLKISSLIYFIPTIVVFIYLIYLKEFQFKWSVTIPKRFRKIIFKYSSLSYVNTLGALIVTTIDALMIASYLGLSETGIYTTIVFITGFLQVPYRSLMRITNPIVAVYWKARDLVKMQELYQKVSSVLLIISSVMFLYIWINREAIFYLLKPEFVTGIPVFLFLMIGRLTDMYLGLNGSIFVMSKKYAYDLIFTFVLIVLVYVLNLIFIPKIGMSGAALSTMIALIVYNASRAYFVWKHYRLHPFTKRQMYVIALFLLNVLLFEFLPHLSNRFVDVLVRSALMTVSFPLLIFIFKMEPELNNYWLKIKAKFHK